MNWRLAGNIVYGILTTVVVLALVSFLIKSNTFDKEDLMWVVLGITFIGLAIYGGIRNPGTGLVWFTRTAGAIIIVLFLGFIFFGQERMNNFLFGGWIDSLDFNEKSSKEDRQRTVIQKAQWTEPVKGEGLPVGVWSKTYEIAPGCSTEYNAGNGSLYKIRYQFYTDVWTEHDGKSYPNASHIQFMVMQDGIKEVPFTISCRQ